MTTMAASQLPSEAIFPYSLPPLPTTTDLKVKSLESVAGEAQIFAQSFVALAQVGNSD